MKQFDVSGMSCAVCSARVERVVSKLPGVSSCNVSLLTNSMVVEGAASDEDIIAAVEDAGYGAKLKEQKKDEVKNLSDNKNSLKDIETPVIKRRLIASIVVLLMLMYFSMGHMMFGLPLPLWFEGNGVAIGLTQLILSGVVMVINQKFFINGFKGLIHRAPNMDTLVAMGSMASFVWSTYSLFMMTDAQIAGDMDSVMGYMHELYFESAAMILVLITVGKMLESYSKGRTTDALKSLMKLAPDTATVIKAGKEVSVSIGQVKKGDVFVVRPGESIPADGVVLEGTTAINESALTGESIPVDKTEGDLVSAATINQSGFIKCEAVRVGEDTTLSQIIKMVSDAAATKAPIAKIADKVSGVFVPVVIFIAAVTIAVWLILGREFGFALARGISVLVISCPCALGLATPVAIMVGTGIGARKGILFKTATSLEETGKTKIVALDKTGTITKGEPSVTDIVTAEGVSEEELLRLAYSLEKKSEHPLARAVINKCESDGIAFEEVTGFSALPGNGLSAMMNERKILGGSMSYIGYNIYVSEYYRKKADELSMKGKTPLFFAEDDKLLGIIAVADVVKEESAQAIKELHDMGMKVVMLTGDNAKTAKAIGELVGVDEIISGVLPDGKEAIIRELQTNGKVIMVGDGINDAPALTRADIGIAIGTGTDVAVDAAEVVLVKNRLSDVPNAIRLSRAVIKNIYENLFWAFIYNIIGIPLAAGIWIELLGWKLDPMFGAAAMSLSSVCVVTNALRLNFMNFKK